MRALFNSQQLWYLLFLFCVLTRIITSIHYIEDIDSLRFAYSIVDEYNILKLQPHFPGYAVFCFIANILYAIVGNMGLTFSIIGGISTFVIIYYSLKLLEIRLNSKIGLFTTLFIFFNPMFWLMSNRYMPDFMGLSVLIASFYFLCQKNNKEILIGCFGIGLLAGIRISYMPILLIPIIIVFINSNNKLLVFSTISFGIIIWFLPMILMTGLENLYNMALKHTSGHFTEYGGTIITETNWIIRLQYFFHTLWSDGLGGYWINRSPITALLSILLFPLIILFIKNIKSIIIDNSNIRILFLSIIVYIIWILLFQNIIYKSRHIMPLVLLLLILFSIIFKNHFLIYNNIKYIYMLSIIIITSYISINLSLQHKEPTAIKKVSQFLSEKEKPMLIISIPLINYYLKSQNINAQYIAIENNIKKVSLDSLADNKAVFVIGNFSEKIIGLSAELDTTFYHNPYVNRMWSDINVYSNEGL